MIKNTKLWLKKCSSKSLIPNKLNATNVTMFFSPESKELIKTKTVASALPLLFRAGI